MCMKTSACARHKVICSIWITCVQHPAGKASLSDCFWRCQSILTEVYNGGLWEIDICNCGAKLRSFVYKQILQKYIYFIMDRSELHFSLHSISGDGSDIHRFPTGSKYGKKHMLFVCGQICEYQSSPDILVRLKQF